MNKLIHSIKNLSFKISFIPTKFILGLICYSLLWFLFTGPDAGSWVIGVPAVLFASFVSWYLSPNVGFSINLLNLFPFLFHFIVQSFLSGIDVMRRALSLTIKINPGFIYYSTELTENRGRTLFVNTISLLPGTLSADIQGNTITVHSLDKELPVASILEDLEKRIDSLFIAKS